MSENIKYPVWPGWETVQLVGRGSYGAVYEIEKDNFGKKDKAALKVISIPKKESEIDELYGNGIDRAGVSKIYEDCLSDMVREYNLMSEMKGNTNIVSCQDIQYFRHSDGIGWDIWIKMELLTPLLRALPAIYDENEAIRLGKDICRALKLCRIKKIVHRDIKPQNIFVSENGDYKLGDFGVARTMEGTTGATLAGTYRYMAPEVYNHQPYNQQADLYSLGLVLYWLLNERSLPFLPLPPSVPTKSDDDNARERRMRGEQLPAPKNGSEELKRIVLKACEFDVNKRYRTADELLEDLEALHDEENYKIPVKVVDEPDLTSDETIGVAGMGMHAGSAAGSGAGGKPVGTRFGKKPLKKKNQSKKWSVATAAVIVVLAVAAVLLFSTALTEKNGKAGKYAAAVALLKAEKYEEAITAFEKLYGYKDSTKQIEACRSALSDIDYDAAKELMDGGKYEEALSAFEALNGYKDSLKQIEECKTALYDVDYAAALSLMINGEYEKAISAFEALDGYEDSEEKIEACLAELRNSDYSAAVLLKMEGKYEEAITAFEALNGYEDSAQQIEVCRSALLQMEKDSGYEAAAALKKEGKFKEALSSYEALEDYKDSKEQANLLRMILPLAYANVGDTVSLGSYEQDNETENGKEDIEWLVLEKKNGQLFLISQHVLDSQKYNSESAYVTWETCSLRTWLNDTFYNDAFSDEEKTIIVETSVSPDKNPNYYRSASSGNKTEDKLFLLSLTEADKYLPKDKQRCCSPTEYSKAQGAAADKAYTTEKDEETCLWWLRTPGSHNRSAVYVYSSGSISYGGEYVIKDSFGVRPAMWIDLNF